MVKPNEARKDLLDRLTPKRSVAFTSNSRFWVYPHPDDHTNHTTQSIHNKTTDMSCAVRVYVLVLNCHRYPVRVNNFAGGFL